MKKIIFAAMIAIAATGCASKSDLVGQRDERVALKEFHKAERRVIRADKSLKLAAAGLTIATAEKINADKDLKVKKEKLDSVLSK